MYAAAQTTTVTNIALLGTGAPVIIILGAVLFLRERIGSFQVLGILCSLAGVVAIVAKGDPHILQHLDLVPGDLWTLAGCFCWATYSLLLRAHGLLLPALALMCICALMGSAALLPLTLWEWARTAHPVDWTAMFWVVIYTALIPGVVGYRLHAYATAVLGAGRSALVNYVAPVYAAFYGWLFFSERLMSYHLVGGALVLAGVWLASRRRT
jgi:drug/metabolite transporter (DMT)-like permease